MQVVTKADQPIPGITGKAGATVTTRLLIKEFLDNGEIFNQIEIALGTGEITLDKIIKGVKKDGIKLSNHKSP